MAQRSEAWQRWPDVWTPPDASSLVQFRSLVSHLFDRYPVPKFMAWVWLAEHDCPWELDLYLHLAAGHSIRQFQLPRQFRPTKRAARLFMQGPDDLSPLEALRWAQVRSLGGDEQLARLVATRTVLGNPTEDEHFWESVIRFLVENSPVCTDETVAIVGFLHQQRFQPAEEVWGLGAGQQPLQPEFRMKGRSLRSLRRHMAHWRTELLAKLTLPVAANPGWEPTGIQPFRQVENGFLWTIEDVLTEKELRAESGIMRHCVATYAHDCARRRTSIWSMKRHDTRRRKRLLTIEVLPRSRTIWEARGKANSPPSKTAMTMLQRWAEQEGLEVSEWCQ